MRAHSGCDAKCEARSAQRMTPLIRAPERIVGRPVRLSESACSVTPWSKRSSKWSFGSWPPSARVPRDTARFVTTTLLVGAIESLHKGALVGLNWLDVEELDLLFFTPCSHWQSTSRPPREIQRHCALSTVPSCSLKKESAGGSLAPGSRACAPASMNARRAAMYRTCRSTPW